MYIQAPSDWGVWYQNGTYPGAAGTWSSGQWYDGAVGSYDGIYQGINVTAGVTYTISFDVNGDHTATTSTTGWQLGVYAGTCGNVSLAPTECSLPSSSGFTQIATPSQTYTAGCTSNCPTNPDAGPTVVSTSTSNSVSTSSSSSNTSNVTVTGTNIFANIGGSAVMTITSTGVTIPGTLTVTGTITVNSSNNATAIVNGGTNGGGNIGASGATFNTVFAKATTAQYADLAENYLADDDYAPGTVLVFGGEQEVTTTSISHDTRVAGVVSTNPAYLMNSDTIGVPVALTGRVPCQVQGPVAKGTVLVTSTTPGVAESLNETQWKPGCVLGKALETINNIEIKTIEIVVGRF